MFLIAGITQQRKQLSFLQNFLCRQCGQYGRYEIWMTCSVLTLFFLPVFRWNRHYTVRTTCCSLWYQLNAEKGRAIERGESVQITAEDLTPMDSGLPPLWKRCPHCGYTTQESFSYCPQCGAKF